MIFISIDSIVKIKWFNQISDNFFNGRIRSTFENNAILHLPVIWYILCGVKRRALSGRFETDFAFNLIFALKLVIGTFPGGVCIWMFVSDFGD